MTLKDETIHLSHDKAVAWAALIQGVCRQLERVLFNQTFTMMGAKATLFLGVASFFIGAIVSPLYFTASAIMLGAGLPAIFILRGRIGQSRRMIENSHCGAGLVELLVEEMDPESTLEVGVDMKDTLSSQAAKDSGSGFTPWLQLDATLKDGSRLSVSAARALRGDAMGHRRELAMTLELAAERYDLEMFKASVFSDDLEEKISPALEVPDAALIESEYEPSGRCRLRVAQRSPVVRRGEAVEVLRGFLDVSAARAL